MTNETKSGFSLIELIVVVAVIALLATIAMVSISGAKEKTTKTKIENDLKAVADIANACNTFAGFAIVHPTHEGNDIAGEPICDTSGITEKDQLASASGNYPALPSGYYYGNAGEGLLCPQNEECSIFDSFALVKHGNEQLNCNFAGCTKFNGW